MLAMFVLWVAGGLSSAEWQKSRKLGGDPTMVNRDPQGIHAHTISNPHFKEDQPSPVKSTKNTTELVPVTKKPKAAVLTPMEVHRNTNGVAMTHLSGQPYMLTTQNGSNGHVANGKPKRVELSTKNLKLPSNRATNNRTAPPAKNKAVVTKSNKSPKHSRKSQSSNGGSTIVAFDPSRTPLRSSLRKPKQQQQLQGAAPPTEGATDVTDAGPEGGIPNPAFVQRSPQFKKKVRIHTQSTAV